jgi:hypothetical protein
MSNKSIDIKRTMSIDDYAYVKGISKDLVKELIKKKKVDSVKLNGDKYIYLTLATIEWNDKD